MNITIAESLRPFCHTPGAACIVPFSAWKITVFPSRLNCENLIDGSSHEFTLSLQGPVKEFTVQQELEEGCVKVFGVAIDGYFRYCLKMEDNILQLWFEKVPASGVVLSTETTSQEIKSGEKVKIGEKSSTVENSLEKLSLGQHKAQDWSAIRKRGDLSEIFPHWLRLGQIIPKVEESSSKQGMLQLLENCERAASSDKMQVKDAFTKLFLAGFSSMLMPRLNDEEHQGIVPAGVLDNKVSAIELLSKGSSVIRSLFFQEKEGVYHLLPSLPPDFHSGRMIRIKTLKGDLIDLEWSKKTLRKAVIHIGSSSEITLSLQKHIESYRVRKSLSSRGVVYKSGDKITCADGDVLYLDRFQK